MSQLRIDQTYMPEHVNDPMMIVFWDVDEVRPVIVSMAIGIPLDALNQSLIIGLVIFFVFRKLREHFPKGILMQVGWWNGIFPLKTSASVNNPLNRTFYR